MERRRDERELPLLRTFAKFRRDTSNDEREPSWPEDEDTHPAQLYKPFGASNKALNADFQPAHTADRENIARFGHHSSNGAPLPPTLHAKQAV